MVPLDILKVAPYGKHVSAAVFILNITTNDRNVENSHTRNIISTKIRHTKIEKSELRINLCKRCHGGLIKPEKSYLKVFEKKNYSCGYHS
jgi:hypothetical protein